MYAQYFFKTFYVMPIDLFMKFDTPGARFWMAIAMAVLGFLV